MVKRRELEFDDELLEKKTRKPKGPKEPRKPKEHQPLIEGGRTDNALAVAIVLSVALLALLILTMKKENWWAVALFGVMFFASEFFALPLRTGGRLSIALLPLIMAMMISGPLGTAVVALFGIPVFYMESGREGWKRIVFNTCQLFVAAGAAGWVFRHTGGQVLQESLKNGGKLVIPWILATIVFFVFNTILVTPVLAASDERMTRFWQKRMLPKLPGYAVYSAIGFFAAIVYLRLEFAGVVLLFTPLLGIRVVYTRYAMMRDVCDDTTLAVMEAVEAGGMFTEGHSVGVADVAVAIAEEMDFADEDLHYLRQAALLHDIGKLALDPRIVDKEGPLTEDDYEEIKKHPLIGGTIVSKEDSFAIVAPTIVHHHEMVDGSGYPDGLSGDTIPIGARILAVADAFDAMKRPSAFRQPLSPYDAASEVIRAKGLQFDPEVVDGFVKVVTKRGVWTGALKEKVRMPDRSVRPATVPGQVAPPVESEEQLTFGEEAGPEAVDEQKQAGATPGDGIAYEQVRDEIEKDIREWERFEVGRDRRRDRGESRRRRAQGTRKKKEREGTEGEEAPGAKKGP